jgi:hypothetical protein
LEHVATTVRTASTSSKESSVPGNALSSSRETSQDSSAPAAKKKTLSAAAAAVTTGESAPHATTAGFVPDAVGAKLREPVVMEAAVFKEAEPAYSLEKQLAERMDGTVVVQRDAAQGTVYSVRVVGLKTTRAVAHAEREIRALGHRPVRIAASTAKPAAADGGTSGDKAQESEDAATPETTRHGLLRPRSQRR